MREGRRGTFKVDGIVLDGWKSFADSVRISIEPGLTGIVGPIGCGKSNVQEAFQWVLGEKSVRRMRGTEPQHLIFGGNEVGRKPRNSAQVTLEISDPNQVFPTEMAEGGRLRIQRRIERDKPTSYRVNGKATKLTDLLLIFKDNATGPSSTGMITQGKVSALITAKPDERRSVLEEAAGISGNLVRKSQFETQIRSAKENLSRAEETAQGVGTIVRTLRRQATQAASAREVETEIERSVASLAAAELAAAIDEVARVEAWHLENENQVKEAMIAERRAATERDLAVERHRRASEALSTATLDEERARRSLAEFGEENGRRRQKLTETRQRVEETREDLEGSVAASAADEERRDLLLAQVEAFASELEATLDEIAAVEPRLLAAVAAREAAEAALSETATALAAARGTRDAWSARGPAVRAALDRATVRRDKATLDLRLATEELAGLVSPSVFDEELAAGDERLAIVDEEREGLTDAIASAKEVEAGLGRVLSSRQSDLNSRSTEVESLRRVRSGASLRADMVPDRGYERAFTAALGKAVYDDGSVSWVEPTAGHPVAPEGVDRLTDHVGGPPEEMRAILSSFVVADLTDAQAVVSTLPTGMAAVSLDGRVVHWHGLVVEPSEDPAANEFRRKARIADLDAEIMGLTDARDRTSEELRAATQRRSALEAGDIRLSTERASLERRLTTVRRSRLEAEGLSTRATSLVETRTLEFVEAERSVADTTRAVEAWREEGEAIADPVEIQERHDAASAILAASRDAERSVEAERSAIRLRSQTFGSRRDAARRELVSLGERTSAAAVRITRLQAKLVELEALTLSLPAPVEDDGSLREALDVASRTRADATRSLSSLDAERIASDRTAGETTVTLARLMETRIRIEEARTTATTTLAEARSTVPEGNGSPLSAEERADLRSRITALQARRQKIGPVNLLAEDDLREQETRLGDMEKAKRETMAAIRDLTAAMEEIDEETRRLMLETFKEIEIHFRKLAGQMFNGGSAYLTLIGDDPLTAGLEVFVSPPGKRIQALSLLSGGERTLASLALVFAAFLANPAPICILDEADAALEDWSVDIFCDLVRTMAEGDETRFVVVTHKPLTMARMDRLYGVTMTEPGISRIARVDVDDAIRLLDDVEEAA